MYLTTSDGEDYVLTAAGQVTVHQTATKDWVVLLSARGMFEGWQDIQAGLYSDYSQASFAAFDLERFIFDVFKDGGRGKGFTMPKNKLSTKKVSFMLDFYLKYKPKSLDKRFAGRFEFIKRFQEYSIGVELLEFLSMLETFADLYNINLKEKVTFEADFNDFYPIAQTYDLEKKTFEACFTEILDIFDLRCDDVAKITLYVRGVSNETES